MATELQSYDITLNLGPNSSADVHYQPTRGFSADLKLQGIIFSNVVIEGDFVKNCDNPSRVFASLKNDYTAKINQIDSVYRIVFCRTPASKIQLLKAKMEETEKFLQEHQLFPFLNKEDQTKIEEFLQNDKTDVLNLIHDENNFEIATEVASYLFQHCKSEKDYISVLLDLTKMKNPKSYEESINKYGDLGKIVIGNSDFKTVFVVYGYDQMEDFFNLHLEYRSLFNYKVIYIIPNSFAQSSDMKFKCAPILNNQTQKFRLMQHNLTCEPKLDIWHV